MASTPSSTTGGGSTGSGTPATGGTGDPATTPPTTPKKDYTAEINSLKGYISNLERVTNPTQAQKTELQTYIARLADYLNH